MAEIVAAIAAAGARTISAASIAECRAAVLRQPLMAGKESANIRPGHNPRIHMAEMSAPGRNDPCPCGSGKKYKKCCYDKAATAGPVPVQSTNTSSSGHAVNTTGQGRAPSKLLLRAVALQQEGKVAEAEAIYRSLLAENPGNFDALHYLGLAALQKGSYQDAVRLIEAAIRLNGGIPAFHCNLGNAYKKLGQLDAAIGAFREAVRLDPSFHAVYTNLGNVFQEQGRFEDAVASYRKAILLRPDFAEAHGNLGRALKALGRYDEALASFQRQLKLAPGNSSAQHQVAQLTGTNTERPPLQYVENLFDGYAEKFDTDLQQKLKYDAPAKLVTLITRHAPPPAEKWRVLDLGCGTGLVGLAIAPFARQLVGVDLSGNMLQKARERSIYQRLERLDLLAMMQGESASSYDVVAAADVFIYLGKLDEVVSEIRRLLGPGGMFAFSIESLDALPEEARLDGAQEYQLRLTGRYAQSAAYLNRLASSHGFRVVEMAGTHLRMENEQPVEGYLVLWQNSGLPAQV